MRHDSGGQSATGAEHDEPMIGTDAVADCV
jgi:hypothetical protein